jgi:hypothetical protein
LFGEPQVLLDLGQERSNGKPSKESDKERPPSAMKGSHVGTRELTKVDFFGPIVLVLVNAHVVTFVLFPLCLIATATEI